MYKIHVKKNELPEYLLPVVKGSNDKGWYLPLNTFYRLLLDPDKKIKPYERIELPNLYPYQNDCLSQMVHQTRLLVSLSPGMGKTVVVSEFLKYLRTYGEKGNNLNTLIVAPKALHYVWKQHIEKYLGITPTIRSYGFVGGVEVTNIQHISKVDFIADIDILIVDESIQLKNKDSQNYRIIKDLLNICESVYFLSGSPYSKNISDLWAQLNLLYPGIFTSYWDFAKIFCEVKIDRYGWKVDSYPYQSKIQESREELLKKVLRPFVFFAHIDDYVSLPEYQETVLEIEPSVIQEKIETAFRKELQYQHIEIDGTLALLTRVKQLYLSPEMLGFPHKSPKLESLFNLLEVVQYPCIVCSSSNVVLQYLHSMYGNSALFTADSEGHLEYLEGKKDLLFMQVMSGKFGHSFTNTRTLIYIDYTYNSDDLYQSLARVKRVTSKLPVTIYHLLCGKLDRVMYSLNKSRNSSIENVLKEYRE